MRACEELPSSTSIPQTICSQISALALSQAEASAREAESSSKEHLEDLLARMEARERWLAGERESLDAKIREATAPATTGRDNHLQAAKALRSEVEALRWGTYFQTSSRNMSLPACVEVLCEISHCWNWLCAARRAIMQMNSVASA